MIAIILAAGYGTRMYPLTETVAKSLLPIGNRTILDIIVHCVDGVPGVDRIIVAANDLFYADFEAWSRDYAGRIPLVITNDKSRCNENRRGAIGEVAFVVDEEELAGKDLLVVGGDNIFDFDLALLAAEMKRRSATVVGVYDMQDRSLVAGKYGVLALGPDNRITDFEEKPPEPQSALISTACYAMPVSDVRRLIQFAGSGDRRDNLGDFVRYLMHERDVYGLRFDGNWNDIGSAEEYERAKKANYG